MPLILRELPILAEATVTVGVVSAGLRLFPGLAAKYVAKQLVAANPDPATSDSSDSFNTEQVAKAIVRSTLLLAGRTTCLSRAIAAQRMLRRRGVHAQLRLSAESGSSPQFSAHAWLETNGLVVLGPQGAGPSFMVSQKHL